MSVLATSKSVPLLLVANTKASPESNEFEKFFAGDRLDKDELVHFIRSIHQHLGDRDPISNAAPNLIKGIFGLTRS